jgi:hypothetical protein
MKKFIRLSLPVLTGILMLIACHKEPNGPAASALGVKVQAINKSFSVLKSVSVTTPSYTWDTCFMNISKIEFEAEKHESKTSDSLGVTYEWDGPKKVNLFDLNTTIGQINLQPGSFDEISIKISALKSDAGTAPVFYLSGIYTNSSDSAIRVVVVVNEDFELKVKQEGSTIDGLNDYTSLIKLNLTLLMSGITNADLTAAVRTNGKIMISGTTNPMLYAKLKTTLVSCTQSELKQGKEDTSGNGNGGESGNGSNNGNGNNGGYGSGYGY